MKMYYLLQLLQLQFINGTVGERNGCSRNNISIYEGYDAKAPLIETLCGATGFRKFLTTHNEAFVTLLSDGSMNAHFVVHYLAYAHVEGKKY